MTFEKSRNPGERNDCLSKLFRRQGVSRAVCHFMLCDENQVGRIGICVFIPDKNHEAETWKSSVGFCSCFFFLFDVKKDLVDFYIDQGDQGRRHIMGFDPGGKAFF